MHLSPQKGSNASPAARTSAIPLLNDRGKDGAATASESKISFLLGKFQWS
jgi:hypothetical protein